MRNKQNRITTLSLFKQLICSLILTESIHSMYKCYHKYFLYLMKVKVLFIWTYEVIIIFLTPGSEKSIKKIQSHKENNQHLSIHLLLNPGTLDLNDLSYS